MTLGAKTRRARAGATSPAAVRRLETGTGTGTPKLVHDVVPTEEPLEIRLNGELVGTTMRTPGHDFELAAGWCLAEGHLVGDLIGQIRYCAGKGPEGNSYNVLDVVTHRGARPAPTRLAASTASCGICGSVAIDELTARLDRLAPVAAPSLRSVVAAAGALGDHQPLFDRTGSVHGAAAFTLADGTAVDGAPAGGAGADGAGAGGAGAGGAGADGGLPAGSVVVVREDVGRHNAVDKLVGRLLLDDRLPATGLGLLLSGRVSVELVQKAWAAGFPVVAAVGGPSSLAVEAADAAGITLVGFVRGDRANVYAGDLRP
ncbi:MAG: formate dehydrogenase accessory sulfurtransferase FdhD [Acidimicrobiia bacterium]